MGPFLAQVGRISLPAPFPAAAAAPVPTAARCGSPASDFGHPDPAETDYINFKAEETLRNDVDGWVLPIIFSPQRGKGCGRWHPTDDCPKTFSDLLKAMLA